MTNIFRNILIASVILSLTTAPVAAFAMPEPVPAAQTDKAKAAAQKKKAAEKRKKEQEKIKAQREQKLKNGRRKSVKLLPLKLTRRKKSSRRKPMLKYRHNARKKRRNALK